MQKSVNFNKLALLSFFVFLFSPMIGFFIAGISIINSSKKPIFQAIVIGLFLGCCAYWVNPKIDIDLVRYFEYVKGYYFTSLEEFKEYVISDTLLQGKATLFFLISRTHDVHLLPFLSTTITYAIAYYISYDYAEELQLVYKYKVILFISLLLFLPFLNIVSNVRNILAFSIFLLGAYRDWHYQKRDIVTWILYIVPVTLHVSSIVLILIRFLVPFLQSNDISSNKKFQVLLFFTIIAVILFYFVEYVPTSLPAKYYRYVFNKAERISSGDYESGSTINQFKSLNRIIIRIYFELLALVYFIVLLKTRNTVSYTNIELFGFLISIVCLSSAPIVQAIYLRFAMILILFGIPIVIKRIEMLTVHSSKFSILFFVALFSSGLIYNVWRLHISADVTEIMLHVFFRPFFIMFSNSSMQ